MCVCVCVCVPKVFVITTTDLKLVVDSLCVTVIHFWSKRSCLVIVCLYHDYALPHMLAIYTQHVCLNYTW